MKILVTAKSAGSASALVSPIKELQRRGHSITVYATGSETEARSFQEVPYLRIEPQRDLSYLVKGYGLVITGIHEAEPDTLFVQAAQKQNIPSISVLEHNYNYPLLFKAVDALPTLIAVMSTDCITAMKQDLEESLANEVVARSRIVGWTAFDDYAQLREEFTDNKRENLLRSVGLNPDQELYVHATQNIHPDAPYLKSVARLREESQHIFEYELKVTTTLFEAASDLGLRLTVKPHPGEEIEKNFTQELAQKHNFAYIPSKACDTKQLVLAAYSVSAGRSTCLAEACLLDRNAGGILPDDLGKAWLHASPAIATKAIPYATEWSSIQSLLTMITSQDTQIQEKLSRDRERFSVDGKASQRLADLAEVLSK